ncbi:glycosyltransferase family 4 protein [Lactococcus lactis]|uniref:glycosyltransferase family 4 protein n=1 Tax=Lactococcus lactis TaxID=1358 RepID=UPI00117A5E60|nr:glycosyltransferase family 4 protein [Lactococcus lactis]MDM7501457.1 glycosyltransferase family 4 protein [Lactococcus lactis]MDM7517919.1 glycosyltransferase family 4 protein [Lactococcus lactis]MDM7520587.1 glycosyltransferase family 4 protein [Lactococcus lactis]TRW65525.1 glycosyltransferase family 4 protein [Lactococcus lactis]TRW70082.1 glycosyltransferase family 4 protein [Lactococcus lactis]
MKKKKVTFILPANYNHPSGGFKIVYQYANWLNMKGFEVSICYCYAPNDSKLYAALKRIVDMHIFKFSKRTTELTWFKLDSNIKSYYNCIFSRDIPDADIILATASTTANFVHNLPNEKGEKFYFIQGYEAESFGNKKGFVEETYRLGLTNIVISKELSQKVLASGAPEPKYLPNFYNHDEFYLETPFEGRKNIISLLNHDQETKRTKFGLEVIREVKKVFENLEVELFGTSNPIEPLEDWIHFTRNANANQLRKEIYGSSKIYLLPSVLEGWGLTGMEAMASGSVLVSSRIGGIVDYANDENSILVEADNKKAFVNAIIELLGDNNRYLGLASQGKKDVEVYSIDKSGERLIKIINGEI